MLLVLLLIVFSPSMCPGFIWPSKNNALKTLSVAETDAQVLGNDIATPLTDQEIDSLHLNYDALQSYPRKNDCFKRATGLIRTRCTELDMDEEARVNAAIAMTLCEVATAKHHSLPLECHPYLHEHSNVKLVISPKVQGECVDSLARSAQFWSSYSGYLREVPQLCHAFRRWNDIDLAKEIYRNVTLEKIALIRFVMNREKLISKHTDKWTDMSLEMDEFTRQFRSMSKEYQSIADKFALLLKDEAAATLQSLRSTAYDILSQHGKSNSQVVYQFQIALNNVAQTHSDELASRVTLFHSSLTSHLEGILALYEARHHQMDHALSSVQERWGAVGGYFDNLTETILRLSDHTVHLSEALETTVRNARNLHILQAESSMAASDLVKTLNHLTETAYAGLGQINGSVNLIGQHLQEHIRKTSQTWSSWSLHMLGFFLRGYSWPCFLRSLSTICHSLLSASLDLADPESLKYLEGQLSFRLLMSFLSFSWTAFRTMASAVSTISVLLFFATSKIFVQKSNDVLSAVVHRSTPVIPSRSERHSGSVDTTCLVPETPANLDTLRKMPENVFLTGHHRYLDDGHRRRVSRIPGRTWNAPAN